MNNPTMKIKNYWPRTGKNLNWLRLQNISQCRVPPQQWRNQDFWKGGWGRTSTINYAQGNNFFQVSDFSIFVAKIR